MGPKSLVVQRSWVCSRSRSLPLWRAECSVYACVADSISPILPPVSSFYMCKEETQRERSSAFPPTPLDSSRWAVHPSRPALCPHSLQTPPALLLVRSHRTVHRAGDSVASHTMGARALPNCLSPHRHCRTHALLCGMSEDIPFPVIRPAGQRMMWAVSLL